MVFEQGEGRLNAEVRRSAGWKARVENGSLLVAILGGFVRISEIKSIDRYHFIQQSWRIGAVNCSGKKRRWVERRVCSSRLVVESLMLVGLGRVWTCKPGADCMGLAPIRSKMGSNMERSKRCKNWSRFLFAL